MEIEAYFKVWVSFSLVELCFSLKWQLALFYLRTLDRLDRGTSVPSCLCNLIVIRNWHERIFMSIDKMRRRFWLQVKREIINVFSAMRSEKEQTTRVVVVPLEFS